MKNILQFQHFMYHPSSPNLHELLAFYTVSQYIVAPKTNSYNSIKTCLTPKTGNTYISGTMTIGWQLQRRNWPPGDCDNDWQLEMTIQTYWSPILQFLAVDHSRNNLANLSPSSSSSKIPNLTLEFRRYLSEYQRCNYFPFWGHIGISGCRSLLYSLANTIFHLYMVLNLRFVVKILTVPDAHIVWEV